MSVVQPSPLDDEWGPQIFVFCSLLRVKTCVFECAVICVLGKWNFFKASLVAKLGGSVSEKENINLS